LCEQCERVHDGTKGEDPRRVHGRREQQVNEFTREMKACLLGAAEDAGNRMVAISNARLPKKPPPSLAGFLS